MEGLKEILKSPPILRQIEYDCSRLVIVTVDTSPIAIRVVTRTISDGRTNGRSDDGREGVRDLDAL
jgi:hypothetical protein